MTGAGFLLLSLTAIAMVIGSGAVAWFAVQRIKVTMFRAGQLHGAQIAVNNVKAAIDSGVDIETLRRGLDTEELTIAEMAERLNT